jgi:RES domain
MIKKRSHKKRVVRYPNKDRFAQIRRVKAIKGQLSIELNTPAGLEKFIEQCIQSKVGRETQQLLSAAKFYQYLRTKNFERSRLISYSSIVAYRAFVNRVVNSLSVVGSKLNGGRFNVGTPQVQQESILPGLDPGACLYAAETLDCAFAEARIHDRSKVRFVKITAKRSVALWNLDQIIEDIGADWPTPIKPDIDVYALGDMWVYQKVPTFSQLIAHRLRQLGGDGLAYKSIRLMDSNSNIYAFFSPDWMKDDVADIFDAVEV